MSKINPGGPAFPLHPDMAAILGCINSQSDCGMTLRDYFAAKAMPVVANGSHVMGQDFLHQDHYYSAALDAYRMADAMMKARES